MKSSFAFRRLNLLVASAVCGVAMMALPQKAHAFLGFGSCPSKNNAVLISSIKSLGQQNNQNIVVVDTNSKIIATSFCPDASKKCETTQKCDASTKKCDASQKCDSATQKCDAANKKCDKKSAKKNCTVDCPNLKQTLADGKTRTVTKTYKGKTCTATVRALRNAKGQIIGAVITAPVKN